MFQRIDHLVITTGNLDACLLFYRLLGFTVRQDGGRCELHAGSFKLNVHQKDRELSPHAGCVRTGSADFCLEIDRPLMEVIEELTKKGLPPSLGPVPRTEAKGPMLSAYWRDPDGNLVELCTYHH